MTSAGGSGVCAQNNSSFSGYLTEYTRNALGVNTQVVQNAQGSTTETRSFAFDWLGRLTSETNPESGTTAFAFDSDSTCGASSGDLVKRVDANGTVTCYAYDALHRVTEISYPTPGPGVAATDSKYFVYDAATVDSTAMVNVKGGLAEAYTGSHVTDLGFSYPNVGAQEEDVYQVSPSSNGWHIVTEQHYANGAAATLTVPGAPALTYGVDGEGRTTTVGAASGQNPVTNAAYGPFGVTELTFGSGDSDSYSYDPDTGRMIGYQFAVAGATDSGTLTWNSDGSLSKLNIVDSVPGTADSQTCTYSHDDLGRLATANCGTTWNQTFSYDPFGNLAKTAQAGTSFSASFDLKNQISENSGFAPNYDADGNLLDDPVTAQRNVNAIDAENEPVTLEGYPVQYEALGRAVERGQNLVLYAPDGSKIAVVYGGTTTVSEIPLPGGGQAVYNTGTPGLELYRHADWLGSVRLETLPNRTLFSESALAPYGEIYNQVGFNDRVFTGQDQITDAGYHSGGQYDFLLREYNPVQGRWWTPDPAGVAAVDPNNPETWNRYAYAGGTPLEATDPFGLAPEQWPIPPGSGNGPAVCTIDGFAASCRWLMGEAALGFALACPAPGCSGFYVSPENHLIYSYGMSLEDQAGWVWFAPNGEEVPVNDQWNELELPDLNTSQIPYQYGGQLVTFQSGPPKLNERPPTLSATQQYLLNGRSYSHSYGAFVFCELQDYMDSMDVIKVVNGTAILGALAKTALGNSYLVGAAAFDVLGAIEVRERCIQQTYGPDYY